MALEWQTPQYPFRFGIDEGTDPRQVPPGSLVQAENVEWLRTGELRKRNGSVAISQSILGGGTMTALSRLLVRNDELAAISGSSLYAYSPSAAAWVLAGTVPRVGVEWSTIVDTAGGVQTFDVAGTASYRIEAWVEGTTAIASPAMFVRVVDAVSGSLMLVPTKLGTGAIGIRALIVNGVGVVVARISSTTIKAWTINLTTFAVSAGTNLVTDGVQVDGYDGWDACVIGDNFVIAYTATGPAVTLASFDNTLAAVTSGGITTEVNGACCISIDGAAGEVLYVVYQSGAAAPSDVLVAIADPSTLAETVAPVTIETGIVGGKAEHIGVARLDATHCVASYSQITGFTRRTTSYLISDAAVVTASSLRSTFGTSPTTRPVVIDGVGYVIATSYALAANSPPPDMQTMVLRIDTSAATASNHPHFVEGSIDTLVGGRFSTVGGPPSGAYVSGTTAYTGALFQSEPNSRTYGRNGLRSVKLTTGTSSRPADMWRSLSRSGEVFVSCGQFTAYDGINTFDFGFPRAPSVYSYTPSTAGSMVDGTYLYATTQEYRSQNFLYRSRVDSTEQAGIVVIAGANDEVFLRIVGYHATNKQNDTTGFGSGISKPTLIALYRSVVEGTVRQRLTIEPTANTNYADLTVESFQFEDPWSDATITSGTVPLSTRPAVYTEGGVLEDEQPPGQLTMFGFGDRLWVLAGDGRTWWYSKTFGDDPGVAPGFSTSFRIVMDEPQVAGAAMDDKAVFFSTTGIRYLIGNGPARDGSGNDFGQPIKVQTDIGCDNPRSLVSMPDGIMFQSGRGIQLLTRGLEVVNIGKPILDTLEAYPEVTSAVVVAHKNQVRFTCNDAGGTAHVVLVYDYQHKQWTTFRYTHGGTYGAGAVADAVMWGTTYTFAMTDGTVYTESSTSHLDVGSSWVPVTIKTAWISAAGPLAFHSVRRFSLFGAAVTDHNLTVSVAFDGDAATETHTFECPNEVTSAGGKEDLVIAIGTRRKCQQIQFTLADASPTTGTVGTGQGMTLSMMGLEVGIKPGLGRKPATKKG